MSLFGGNKKAIAMLSSLAAGNTDSGLGRVGTRRRRKAVVAGKFAASARKAVNAFVAGRAVKSGSFESDGVSLKVGSETFATRRTGVMGNKLGSNRVQVCVPSTVQHPRVKAAAGALLRALGTGVSVGPFSASDATLVMRGGRAGSGVVVPGQCAEVVLKPSLHQRASAGLLAGRLAKSGMPEKTIRSQMAKAKRTQSAFMRVRKQVVSNENAILNARRKVVENMGKANAATTAAAAKRYAKAAGRANTTVNRLVAKSEKLRQKASVAYANFVAFKSFIPR